MFDEWARWVRNSKPDTYSYLKPRVDEALLKFICGDLEPTATLVLTGSSNILSQSTQPWRARVLNAIKALLVPTILLTLLVFFGKTLPAGYAQTLVLANGIWFAVTLTSLLDAEYKDRVVVISQLMAGLKGEVAPTNKKD
jgi:hypothetical protein